MQGSTNPSGALYEAVRTPHWSAMYKVGYSPQCCRDPITGNANTPFNKTCTSANSSHGFKGQWLDTPLLFDMTADVGQEAPLAPGSPQHRTALTAIQSALKAHNASLHDGKLQSVPVRERERKGERERERERARTSVRLFCPFGYCFTSYESLQDCEQ